MARIEKRTEKIEKTREGEEGKGHREIKSKL